MLSSHGRSTHAMQAASSPLSWFGNNQTPFISKPLGSLLPQGTCWSWALASIKLPRLQRDRDRVESPRTGVGKRPCLLQRIHVLPKPSTTAPIVV